MAGMFFRFVSSQISGWKLTQVLWLTAAAVSVIQCQSGQTNASAKIRPPAVAGQFYSDNPEKLRSALNYYLDQAIPDLGCDPQIIIVPHAGYIYSGQITADAFSQIRRSTPELVVILGTNHTTAGADQVSFFTGAGYETPLGIAPINQDITQQLIESSPLFTYRPEMHRKEHSVEVQIPFIQVLFPKTPIVSAIVGKPDSVLCRHLANSLHKHLNHLDYLVIASSDLSHYPDYQTACRVDSLTIRQITGQSVKSFFQHVTEVPDLDDPALSTCACGAGPVMTAMILSKMLNLRGHPLSYANSGDCLIGDQSRVVGYGSILFSKLPPHDMPPAFTETVSDSLTDIEKRDLLEIARETIETYLTTGVTPLIRHYRPSLSRRQGAFVTLKINHQLRGCIGHMAEDLPLAQVVASMSLQAAFNDRRFSPVSLDEWPDIEIEISVLTPFTEIPTPDRFQTGRDGIVIRHGGRSAVYLPQVAPEQGWNRFETLEHLCRKAGLPRDAWLDEQARLFTFQAVVFSESDLKR